jgi:large subunit ribosomal protein L21
MHAVIQTGGKQYRVKEGDVLSVEKLEADNGQMFNFDRVLLIEDGETVLVGTPVLADALVRAEVVETYKDEKVLVFKKKRRKQYRRTRGHRQQLTKIKVERIIPDKTLVAADELRIEKPKPKPVEAAPAPNAAPHAPQKTAPAAKKAAPAAAKAPARPKAAPKKAAAGKTKKKTKE